MEGMTQMESEEEEALVEETAGDEVAAAGVAGAAAASGGTGSASAAKPKARPRKLAKPAGKKAPKSSPTFFTGKAAGLPPPSKEACEGPPPEVEGPSVPVGMGAYLVYKDADGGKLLTQWSKEPLTGAGVLAYLRPEKEVGDYKFEKKSAIEVHATNCQKFMSSEFPADRIKFYEGWASFFKLLSSCGGSITLLPAAGAEPPPKVKIVLANKGKPEKIKQLAILFHRNIAAVSRKKDTAIAPKEAAQGAWEDKESLRFYRREVHYFLSSWRKTRISLELRRPYSIP
ncbi:KED, related protein [Cyclospora cayetanensis]|uniref:KED, related protein n=1 Tax=Cyclospora cayetanensis TaxID=88456 RepID=A0A1D3CWP1_9EIME|nr:KED, related protein [Cyclospora cayetanensis]